MSRFISRIKSTFNEDYDPEKDTSYVDPTNENVRPSAINIIKTHVQKKTSDIGQKVRTMTNSNNLNSLKKHIDAILNDYNNQYATRNADEGMIDKQLKRELREFIKNIESNDLLNLKRHVANNHLKNTPAYEFADKQIESYLEHERDISVDKHNNILSVNDMHNRIGGSYKKRNRPSLKKTRRVKRRKTMRK
jgi:hypothetical protein